MEDRLGRENYAYIEGNTRAADSNASRQFQSVESRGGYAWARRARQHSDEEIRTTIAEAYRQELQIWKSKDVRVKVKNGIVTLKGSLANRAAKVLAGEIAWACPGVLDVFNLIEIR